MVFHSGYQLQVVCRRDLYWVRSCFLFMWMIYPIMSQHRENSPVTQTTPEPTLLSWGGWPRQTPPHHHHHPHPHPHPPTPTPTPPPPTPPPAHPIPTPARPVQNSRFVKQSSDLKTSSIHVPLQCHWKPNCQRRSVSRGCFVDHQYSRFGRIPSAVGNRYRKSASLLKRSVSIASIS